MQQASFAMQRREHMSYFHLLQNTTTKILRQRSCEVPFWNYASRGGGKGRPDEHFPASSLFFENHWPEIHFQAQDASRRRSDLRQEVFPGQRGIAKLRKDARKECMQ